MWSVPREDDCATGVAGGEHAAVAVRDRELRPFALRGGLAAELPRRFQEQEHAAHARVIRAEAATVGVEGGLQGAVEAEALLVHKRSAFALLAEAQVLEHHH